MTRFETFVFYFFPYNFILLTVLFVWSFFFFHCIAGNKKSGRGGRGGGGGVGRGAPDPWKIPGMPTMICEKPNTTQPPSRRQPDHVTDVVRGGCVSGGKIAWATDPLLQFFRAGFFTGPFFFFYFDSSGPFFRLRLTFRGRDFTLVSPLGNFFMLVLGAKVLVRF